MKDIFKDDVDDLPRPEFYFISSINFDSARSAVQMRMRFDAEHNLSTTADVMYVRALLELIPYNYDIEQLEYLKVFNLEVCIALVKRIIDLIDWNMERDEMLRLEPEFNIARWQFVAFLLDMRRKLKFGESYKLGDF